MTSNPQPPQTHLFSKETWVFLALTILCVFTLLRFVDLTPHVDQEFFFSSEDPHYKADREISNLFTRKDSQIIISVRGDIHSTAYEQKIRRLSELLLSFDAVSSVKSVSHGPRNVEDAIRSPFWKRLLIADNESSTNVIVIVDENIGPYLVPKIEDLIAVMQNGDFHIEISGFPYVVEMIRRYLVRDLHIFSSLAVVLFGVVILFIFHSWRILLGMMSACLQTCALTFMITHLLHIKIGILTANLATIVFVMTISHCVFLTFNWKNLHKNEAGTSQYSAVKKAMYITLMPSFWSMATTLMGFFSLLFVPAKPLRELGISGAIGTLVAFFVAYSVYPPFLCLKDRTHLRSSRSVKHYHQMIFKVVEKRYRLIITLIIAFIVITLPSLKYLNTDPSLISYFSERSDITKGLEYIDRNGGSSPLILILKTESGETLNTNKTYRQLWELQKDLEEHPDVGTIISLPTLMSEGKRLPFSFFLVWDWYLDVLEEPQYDRIARSFISRDRKYGLFLLRMNEMGRTGPRLEVIEEIKNTVRKHHFVPHLVGGIYALQGHLSKLVASSLIFGLSQLILLFVGVALIVSRSVRISLAMTLSISLIPLCILGGIGLLGIPLDTISAPAANIAISMGIDAMIHITNNFRRLVRGRHKCRNTGKTWARVRKIMWEPVVTSISIVSIGFAIFFFSSFPPTQRFGGAIVFGTITTAMVALFIFPALSRKES